MNTVPSHPGRDASPRCPLFALCALCALLFSFTARAQQVTPIRILADSAVRQQFAGAQPDGSPILFTIGDTVEFDIGLEVAGTYMQDFTNQAQFVLLLTDSQTDSSNSPFMVQTLTNFNSGCTNWADFFPAINTNCSGTAWSNSPWSSLSALGYPTNFSLRFIFPTNQTAIYLAGQASQSYWLRLYSLSTNLPTPRVVTWFEGLCSVQNGPVIQLPAPGPNQYALPVDPFNSLVSSDSNFFVANSNLLNQSVNNSHGTGGGGGGGWPNIDSTLATNTGNLSAAPMGLNDTNFSLGISNLVVSASNYLAGVVQWGSQNLTNWAAHSTNDYIGSQSGSGSNNSFASPNLDSPVLSGTIGMAGGSAWYGGGTLQWGLGFSLDNSGNMTSSGTFNVTGSQNFFGHPLDGVAELNILCQGDDPGEDVWGSNPFGIPLYAGLNCDIQQQPFGALNVPFIYYNITNANGNLALRDTLYGPTWNLITQTASGNTTLTLPTSTNWSMSIYAGNDLTGNSTLFGSNTCIFDIANVGTGNMTLCTYDHAMIYMGGGQAASTNPVLSPGYAARLFYGGVNGTNIYNLSTALPSLTNGVYSTNANLQVGSVNLTNWSALATNKFYNTNANLQAGTVNGTNWAAHSTNDYVGTTGNYSLGGGMLTGDSVGNVTVAQGGRVQFNGNENSFSHSMNGVEKLDIYSWNLADTDSHFVTYGNNPFGQVLTANPKSGQYVNADFQIQPGGGINAAYMYYNITNLNGNCSFLDNWCGCTWNMIVQTASGATTLTLPTSTNWSESQMFSGSYLFGSNTVVFDINNVGSGNMTICTYDHAMIYMGGGQAASTNPVLSPGYAARLFYGGVNGTNIYNLSTALPSLTNGVYSTNANLQVGSVNLTNWSALATNKFYNTNANLQAGTVNGTNWAAHSTNDYLGTVWGTNGAASQATNYTWSFTSNQLGNVTIAAPTNVFLNAVSGGPGWSSLTISNQNPAGTIIGIFIPTNASPLNTNNLTVVGTNYEFMLTNTTGGRTYEISAKKLTSGASWADIRWNCAPTLP